MDVEVAHNLRCGVDPTDADLPRVIRINHLESIDGEELGAGEVRLDLGDLAIDAVVAATNDFTFLLVRLVGTDVWGPSGPENWREIGKVIRAACFHYRRMRWSGPLNRRLIEMVSHIAEHGCGTVSDIADQLGTTPARVHTQLNKLRETNDIERLPPGRPSGSSSV